MKPTPTPFMGKPEAPEIDPDYSNWDFIADVADLDFAHNAIGRMAERAEAAAQQPFELGFEWSKDDLEGIPSDYWDRFQGVDNQAEFDWVKAELQREMEVEQRIGSKGIPGMAARLGVNLFDPTAIGLAVATEGTAAPLVYGNKLTRLQRALRTGGLVAAESAALESVLVAGNPISDEWDIAYAAGIGAVLGGGLGSLGRTEADSIKAHREVTNRVEANAAARQVDPSVQPTNVPVSDLDDEGNLVPNGEAPLNEVEDRLEDAPEPPQVLARQEPESVEAVPQPSAEDSVGASRVADSELLDQDTPTERLLENAEKGNDPLIKSPEEIDAEAPEVSNFMGNIRWDMAKRVLGNVNNAVRYHGGKILMDPTGKGGKEVAQYTATEEHRRLLRVHSGRYYQELDPAYKQWAEARGYGMFSKTFRSTRRAYVEEVGEWVRRTDAEPEDPAIARGVAATRAFFKDYLQEAKDAGLRGFEDVEFDDNFLPRFFDHGSIEDIRMDVSTEYIEQLLDQSFWKANSESLIDSALYELRTKYDVSELSPEELLEQATKIARKDSMRITKGYFRNITARSKGFEVDGAFGIRVGDENILKDYLDELVNDPEAGTTAADAARIIERMRNMTDKKAANSGKVKHAKSRLNLDENFEMDLPMRDSPGKTRRVKVSDLFSSNVEDIATRYQHSMAGRIALARYSGIQNLYDWEKVQRNIRAQADARGELAEAEEGIEAMDVVIKHLMGQSTEDVVGMSAKSQKHRRYLKLLRDFNFLRVMNQVGFAQLADMGNIINSQYGRALMKGVPSMRRLITRAGRGDIDDKLVEEMEEIAGLGMDFTHNQMYTVFDEIGYKADEEGWIGRLEHGARVGGRLTQVASGMAPINAFMQRLAGQGIVQKFFHMAKGIEDLDPAMVKRMRNMGLDDEMTERVFEQLRRHAETNEGGKVTAMGIRSWDDGEAARNFINAFHRESRRMVQENDISASAAIMNGTLGKTLFQFRTFLMNAHTRQGLHNLSLNDRHSWNAMFMQSFFAGLSWTAQMSVKIGGLMALGLDDRAEELRERLNAWDIGKTAVARSAYAGIAPAIADAGMGLLDQDPIFANARSSGLEVNLITGNPTYDLGKNVFKATSGLANVALGGDASRADISALLRSLPFQNLLLWDSANKAVSDFFPERGTQNVIAEERESFFN